MTKEHVYGHYVPHSAIQPQEFSVSNPSPKSSFFGDFFQLCACMCAYTFRRSVHPKKGPEGSGMDPLQLGQQNQN